MKNGQTTLFGKDYEWESDGGVLSLRPAPRVGRMAVAHVPLDMPARVSAPEPLPKRQRGKCSACPGSFALTKAGRVWKHAAAGERGLFCAGSGEAPEVTA